MSNNPKRDRVDVPPDEERREQAAQRAKQQQQKRQGFTLRIPGTVRTPFVTYVLIAINAILFLHRYIDLESAVAVLEWGVGSTDAIVNGREIYRLFTMMFLHANEAHIVFNMIALYYIGSNLERLYGHVRFALIYLLGGLAGSVLIVLFGTDALGASGAVFAIFGSEAFFFWMHRKLYGEVALRRIRSSTIIIVLNFVFGFGVNAANAVLDDGGAVISNLGHAGGLIGGIILTWLVAPRYRAVRVDNPKVGEAPIRLESANPIGSKIQHLLYYAAGLAALLLMAIIIQGM